MKRNIPFLLAGVIGLLLACNREDSVLPDPSMSASYDMVCKDFIPLKSEAPGEDQSCVFWEYDGDSTLTMTHYNAGFNCCPEEILTSMKISGDTLYVTEREKYVVTFIEEYVIAPDPPLVFEIDLENDLSGDVCQDRDYYPWGSW